MSDKNVPEIHENAAPLPQDAEVEQKIRRMSRRSFLWGGVALAAGIAGKMWINSLPPDAAYGISWPFRRVLETNEKLAEAYFSGSRLAPTFPRSMATQIRPNGDIGLSAGFKLEDWQLKAVGLQGGDRSFTIEELKRLPRVEMVTEFKCIEGWSTIVQWAGARMADFVAAYPPVQSQGKIPEYVGMTTPDGGYYVGLDRESALHPQTLLCYEMNGEPLALEHGAPLRLVIPVKYGIKNIKRIGTIHFTDQRPDDFWANKYGYDWYAGH